MTQKRHEPTHQPRPDAVLSALVDEHRRAVLRQLDETEQVAVDTLADRLAGATDGPTDDNHQRTRIALSHTHLPVLDEAGLVQYDQKTDQVRAETDTLTRELLTAVEPYEPD